jgi:type VI secretion system secreted protein VgrG
MPEGRTTFEFRAGSLQESDLVVKRIQGKEGLSEPYGFDVDFFPSSGDALEPGDLCGTEALLTVRRPDGSERYVHGLVGSLQMTNLLVDVPHYRGRIISRMERLRHQERSRIFQDISVPDIVKQVLDAGEVTQRWSLEADYPERDYCVQYDETDFDFVSRLLEEVGIFYFFEHDSDDHTLVLVDAVSAATDNGTQVPFRTEGKIDETEDESESLFRLEQRRRVAVSKVSLRDFDFENPGVDNSAEKEESTAPETLEWYEYPGGFTEPDAGTGIAQVRLEEQRSDVRSCEGDSSCLAFQPGSVFEAIEHPDPACNGKLLLVRVSHEGTQQQSSGEVSGITHAYRNGFEAIASDAPFRPARQTPRPQAFPTTATVVGPSGEEIYPDSHGRVKVQFHWDRDGQNDDKSSCWIRCAQSWAGAGFGALILPRIGQEVLVKFLEGDPDQPLVAGATYNGEHPPPVSLPEEKTTSVQRSDSSLGGDGSNEMRLEDEAGRENIYLHAQHDENIEVLADKVQAIDGNESLEVVKDRSQEVQGNQDLSVDGSETGSIGGDQTLSVTGNRETRVTGSHFETVLQDQTLMVTGPQSIGVQSQSADLVGGAASLNVGGAYGVQVMAAMNVAVEGALTRSVVGSFTEAVIGERDETVVQSSHTVVGGDINGEVKGLLTRNTGGDQGEDLRGKWDTEVKDVTLWQAKEFNFKAETLNIIVDGNTVLSIDDSGNIEFGVKSFTLEASGEMVFKGSSVSLDGSDSASSGSADVPKLDPMKGDRASVDVSLKFDDDAPVPNEWISAKFPDGTTRAGKTDSSGKATIYGPKEGKVKLSLIKRDKSGWKSG